MQHKTKKRTKTLAKVINNSSIISPKERGGGFMGEWHHADPSSISHDSVKTINKGFYFVVVGGSHMVMMLLQVHS